jgi:hypothetical protein
MPIYYLHLAAIVAVQLAALLGLNWTMGTSGRVSGRFFRLAFLGTCLGLVFEIFMGAVWNIFQYPGAPRTVAFLMLNSAFSYGTALFTVWLLPCSIPIHGSTKLRLVAAVSLTALIGIFVLLSPTNSSQPVRVFVVGAFTITAAELSAATMGRIGPLLAITRGQFSPLACLVIWSAVIGAIYEAANYLLPLWRWNLGPDIPDWATEILVITFGYFVLLHPMFVLSRATCGEPR